MCFCKLMTNYKLLLCLITSNERNFWGNITIFYLFYFIFQSDYYFNMKNGFLCAAVGYFALHLPLKIKSRTQQVHAMDAKHNYTEMHPRNSIRIHDQLFQVSGYRRMQRAVIGVDSRLSTIVFGSAFPVNVW